MVELTQKDCLTGFYLRGLLNPFLEDLILVSAPKKKKFSLVLIDLDRFKKFNDKFGHAFGDEILKYVTGTLRLTFSETQSYIFRYGGDEFIAVFPDQEPKETYRWLQQCNYNLSHRPFLFKNKFYKITLSCGVSGFPIDEQKAEELIQKADKAMYFSKHHGRSLITLANRMNFLKVRSFIAIVCSISMIVLSVFIAYRLSFKKLIQPALIHFRDLKVTTKPQDLDLIITKGGVIFEGRIVSETQDKVILNLYMEKGQGTTVFEKKEIIEIKYGLKPSR